MHIESRDIGMAIIGDELEAELNNEIAIPDFADKYLFIESEWYMKGNKSRELYYVDMIERHSAHIEELCAETSYIIRVDLDHKCECYENFTLSLRNIILDLEVGDEK